MGTTRVLLIRHAETSAPHQFHGAESDVGLGDRGRRQAEDLAWALAVDRPDGLVCSAMRRAVETAGPVAFACDLTPAVEPDLHERKMGPLSGLPREEGLAEYQGAKRHWVAGDLGYTHPGGESFADVRDRCLPVFHRLAEKWQGKSLAVIAHGVVIRVLLCSLLDGKTPADFDAFAIDNVGVNDLRLNDGRWTAAALNRVAGEAGDSFAW